MKSEPINAKEYSRKLPKIRACALKKLANPAISYLDLRVLQEAHSGVAVRRFITETSRCDGLGM
jgi:hypothetical protein